MAISLDTFKHIARIDYDEDDVELQLYLDSATEIIERYTNHSLRSKVITFVSDGHVREVFESPILSVSGGDIYKTNSMSVIISSRRGDTVAITLGVSDIKSLEYSVYDVALTMYEEKGVTSVKLPLDIQAKINQFRRDDFIS